MARMERQEKLHLQREAELVQLGVKNIALEEDKQRSSAQIDRLRLLLHENETRQATSHAYLEQLLAHIEEQERQYKGALALQNQTMEENARLHATTEVASRELERTAHVSRDLEYANKVVRDENEAVQGRVQTLLETVGTLREELRTAFKTVEQSQANAATERNDWHAAMKTLEGENQDLRRRLRWLERAAASSNRAGKPA